MADTIATTTVKILQCDDPSPYTGRVYPRDVMERAIANYQEKIDGGTAFGTCYEGADIYPEFLSIANISHLITELSINEHGEVIAEVAFLNTPGGKQISQSHELHRLSPAMIGMVDNDDDNGVFSVSKAEIFQTTWFALGDEKD